MHTEIVTTITTRLDLETLEPSHSVHVDMEDDGIPRVMVFAMIEGGCRATIDSIRKQEGRPALEYVDKDYDDDATDVEPDEVPDDEEYEL